VVDVFAGHSPAAAGGILAELDLRVLVPEDVEGDGAELGRSSCLRIRICFNQEPPIQAFW
jgi:hypothetical protein